jgi:fructose-bisphosphate aldolase class 1
MRTHPGFIAALDQSGGSAPPRYVRMTFRTMHGPTTNRCVRSCICSDKAKAEDLLKAAIMEELDALPVGQLVMLKLTLPDKDELYASAIPRL